MKWLLIAIIVFAQQPAKTPQHKRATKANSAESTRNTKGTKNDQTQPAQPTPTVSQTPVVPESKGNATTASDHAQQGNKQTSEEDQSTQRKLTIFTGVLAIVGVLQLVVMFLTWMVYRRQAREMRKQRHEMGRQRHVMFRQWRAMREQGGLMERQTGILEKSVVAAEKSAESAARDIDLFIAKERAWLRITIEGLSIPQKVPSWAEELTVVNYEIHHFGPTEATIVESTAKAVLTDSQDIPVDTDIIGLGPESQIIKPSQPPRKYNQPVWRETDFTAPTAEDIDAMLEGTKFIHFWGFVSYADRFGKRITRFRYLWKRSPFQFGSARARGFWQKYGPHEDNSET